MNKHFAHIGRESSSQRPKGRSGDYTITFTHLDSDPMLDTEVSINGIFLCVISGNDVERFVMDFNHVIEKYRI